MNRKLITYKERYGLDDIRVICETKSEARLSKGIITQKVLSSGITAIVKMENKFGYSSVSGTWTDDYSVESCIQNAILCLKYTKAEIAFIDLNEGIECGESYDEINDELAKCVDDYEFYTKDLWVYTLLKDYHDGTRFYKIKGDIFPHVITSFAEFDEFVRDGKRINDLKVLGFKRINGCSRKMFFSSKVSCRIFSLLGNVIKRVNGEIKLLNNNRIMVTDTNKYKNATKYQHIDHEGNNRRDYVILQNGKMLKFYYNEYVVQQEHKDSLGLLEKGNYYDFFNANPYCLELEIVNELKHEKEPNIVSINMLYDDEISYSTINGNVNFNAWCSYGNQNFNMNLQFNIIEFFEKIISADNHSSKCYDNEGVLYVSNGLFVEGLEML